MHLCRTLVGGLSYREMLLTLFKVNYSAHDTFADGESILYAAELIKLHAITATVFHTSLTAIPSSQWIQSVQLVARRFYGESGGGRRSRYRCEPSNPCDFLCRALCCYRSSLDAAEE